MTEPLLSRQVRRRIQFKATLANTPTHTDSIAVYPVSAVVGNRNVRKELANDLKLNEHKPLTVPIKRSVRRSMARAAVALIRRSQRFK